MTAEEIKEEKSMKDVLAIYGLQPNRSNFIPCPFHQGDREASCKIYQDSFYCFGCGATGDIFTFVQLMDHIPFKEAFQLLGGTYKLSSRETRMIQIAKIKQEQKKKAIKEKEFQQWKKNRLNEVCRLLRILEQLKDCYEVFSDEWVIFISMKQKNEYYYQVLAFGSREEQEDMRRLNE